MPTYRQIAIGEDAPHAVTVGIERNPEGNVGAAVWWPAHDDVDGDEATYTDVIEAFEAAHAAKNLHGFPEIVVTLQDDALWDPKWGTLTSGIALSDAESFELARATEANRDA
jgi:hypothetical protein